MNEGWPRPPLGVSKPTHGPPRRSLDHLDLCLAEFPGMWRQRNEMDLVQQRGLVLRRLDAPQQEPPDRGGRRRVVLLLRNDGVFIADQRIGRRARRERQRQAFIRRRPWPERGSARSNALLRRQHEQAVVVLQR